ncbi:phosphatase PAP2 family protein [Haloarculaceae archaeon H-GB2-1]|nr:phosphatase PAP2 family protein [Haloarculaceae archaeon H-GB2-1]
MGLLDVLTQVGAVVVALHLVALVVVVGPKQLWTLRCGLRTKLRTIGPSLGVLVTVLLANGVVRNVGVELSWIIGLNITGGIHAVEGRFVAHLQSLATPPLTAYFGFVYVFGYVFLLTFPLVAYLVLADTRPLHTLVVAYVVNYGLGLVCYVVFVSYGPRNFMPELVSSLLYNSWPQSQLLTSQVNVNTNVFPSLHTSLSATVGLLAYRYRERFPAGFRSQPCSRSPSLSPRCTSESTG